MIGPNGDDPNNGNTTDDASEGTNAHAKDDAGDQALIDLVPVPSDSQSPDDSDTFDPLAGIFG
jgi:hypothetical protein